MNTTLPSPTELTHRAEAAMRDLNDRVRSVPERGRELLHSRRANALLRELGELYYDAHRDTGEVDTAQRDDILAALDQLLAGADLADGDD